MFNIPKSKTECVGKPETGKARLMQIAEVEHDQKMKVLLLKEQVLELKKRKLQKELADCRLCNHSKKQKASNIDSNLNHSTQKQPSPCVWQPF